jgi:predicted NUDIX family phosphoesterase
MSKPQKLEMIASVTSQFCEDYGLVQGFNHVDFDHFIEEATPHMFLRQREWQDNCYNGEDSAGKEKPRGDKYGRQLLPYVPVLQELASTIQMQTYRRLKGNGEARMVGDVSAGFGGHADKADVLSPVVHPHGLVVDNLSSIPDWAMTIMNNAHREVGKEELTFWVEFDEDGLTQINPTTHPEYFRWKFEGLIIDNSNDVGWLHLGIVVSCTVSAEVEVRSGEVDKLELMDPMTPRELLDADLPREPWTTILAEYLADAPSKVAG